MSLESKYNLKSPGVKRLMREAVELANPTEEYFATPLEDNLFEWHFTVRGPSATEFEGGYYHGRILLPSQYPMQPPNIILLTPNGRFEVNKKNMPVDFRSPPGNVATLLVDKNGPLGSDRVHADALCRYNWLAGLHAGRAENFGVKIEKLGVRHVRKDRGEAGKRGENRRAARVDAGREHLNKTDCVEG